MKWILYEDNEPHCFAHILVTNGKEIRVNKEYEDADYIEYSDGKGFYPTHYAYINLIELPNGGTLSKECIEKGHCCNNEVCPYGVINEVD